MSGPVRELQIAENLMLYVSDQGFLVIAQDMGDASYVALHPEQIDEVIAGMKALKESTVCAPGNDCRLCSKRNTRRNLKRR